MNIKNGQSRVIIENVQPQVDGGLYPAKRTVGEHVLVTADIFGDGHDHIRAHLLYKKMGDGPWSVTELKPAFNDQWLGTFDVRETGTYVFTVKAWVDHLESWYDGFRKKASAKIGVQVELMEGALMLKKFSDPSLTKAIATLEDTGNYAAAVDFVQSDDFSRLVHNHPLVEFESNLGKELVVVVEHKKANFSTWYELFPRSSSLEGKHGTLRDVVKLLPRIAAMGFDVLYLPPIHPIGTVNRKGKNNAVRANPGEPGSPWAIGSGEGGHKSIHPALGSLDDLHKLVAEAKKHAIDLALDIAFQCAPDHPYVKEHPDWFRQRPDGTIQYAENPPKKYQDIYPFNFETRDWQALWEELRSVFFYWIGQGVTIFRVDNPHTKPIRFWQWLIAEVNARYNNIIFLSEAFTRPRVMAALAKAGFTQSYTYFTWRVSKQELTEYMHELVHSTSRNYFRPNFWPNTPDILPYHLQHQGENIFILRLALAATLSSNYGIYGPPYEMCENIPLEGREEYFESEKYEVKKYDWKQANRLTDIITIVNRARHNHPALQSTWNIQFCHVENPHLLAYLKATDDLSDIFLIIVNLDPHGRQSGYIQLPKERLRLGDAINVKLHDLMTDEHYTWTQEWNYAEIDPYKMPFHLFRMEIHESNM